MMQRSLTLWSWAGCGLLCVFSLGCNDGLARVSGTVTFNGEPVSRGMINLEPVDGVGPMSGGSIAGGQYAIEQVTPGGKIVRIRAVYTKSIQKDPSDGSELEICDDLLPKEYGQHSQEKLTVSAPATMQDYTITGPDPRKPK